LIQETNVFAARFTEKFSIIYADHFQATAMIHPGNHSSHRKEQLELDIPYFAFQGQQTGLKIAKPISVKINMPSFIL
jgi:hypothetical protein